MISQAARPEATPLRATLEEPVWILEVSHEGVEEALGGGAINQAVVKRERKGKERADNHLPLPGHRLLLNPSEPEDRHLGWVDDGGPKDPDRKSVV